MSERLFLIDGTALAYRSYFAMMNSRLRNAEGIPTGAIYGFANALSQLLEQEKPTHIAVVWDTHAPTFRHEMDENYKANRPPQPEDLRVAIPLIKEMIGGFGCHNIEKDGYEADDLIGTLAYQAHKKDVMVYMVTPDKDFMQLVGDNIFMVKPRNRGDGFELIDEKGVEKFFGVKPAAVVDVLAMMGDSSDNIPGVPGIGKKGAAAIIRDYGSLDEAVRAASGMKNKRAREGLTEYREQVFKSREMICIHTSVPGTIHWSGLKWKGVRNDKLLPFFRRMQFRTLEKKYSVSMDLFSVISGTEQDRNERAVKKVHSHEEKENRDTEQGLQVPSSPEDYEEVSFTRYDKTCSSYMCCSTHDMLELCLNTLGKTEKWSFDTETTSKDPGEADLLGISFSMKESQAWYIPISLFSKDEIINYLAPLFSQPKILKIAHHFKYDYRVLHRYGLKVKGPVFDTMLAAHLVDADQKLDMNALSRKYLLYDPIPIEQLIGEKGKGQLSMDQVPLEAVSAYACEDADITLRLHNRLEKELQEKSMQKLADEIEFPLSRILGDMEQNGILLDTRLLDTFSAELKSDLSEVQDEIFHLSEEEFNIQSTQQLGVVLFEKMGLPAGKRTATGKYSTSEDVLRRLASTYEIAAKVLEFRKLSKLASTYVDALPKLADPQTRRVHTTFNQHVTVTGRLSSTHPNLQNIPVRTERGRGIRKSFVSAKGYKLLSADYSQIELRIIASMSGDQSMVQSFHEGEDIHARTAAEIFGLQLDQIQPEHRRKAKEVNFGIPYGVSAYGLSQRLGVSNKEGKQIIDAYFERFPAIRTFIADTIEFARDKGYVETLSGRRRMIPDIHSANPNIRGFAERTAVNMPIQGTAADIIKLAMIRIDRELQKMNSKTRMLLQVHDELVLEIPDSEIHEIPDLVKLCMEEAFELKVPLKISQGISDNWLDAH